MNSKGESKDEEEEDVKEEEKTLVEAIDTTMAATQSATETEQVPREEDNTNNAVESSNDNGEREDKAEPADQNVRMEEGISNHVESSTSENGGENGGERATEEPATVLSLPTNPIQAAASRDRRGPDSSNSTNEPSSLSASPVRTAAATRNGRAQRMARKREQFNNHHMNTRDNHASDQANENNNHSDAQQSTPLTTDPPSPNPMAMVRSRLPPMTSPPPEPNHVSPTVGTNVAIHPASGDHHHPLPGDDLNPSVVYTSRARQNPTTTGGPHVSTVISSGPLPPPSRRVKGGMPPTTTPMDGSGHSNTAAAAAVPTPPVDENLQPGAYQARGRAIGDLPQWARDRQQQQQQQPPLLPTLSPPPPPQQVLHPSGEAALESDAANANPGSSTQMEMERDQPQDTGLATAEAVTDAETVVYAEDVKEDEIVQNRRRFIWFAVVAVAVILALVLTLVILQVEDGDDECNWPLEDQTIDVYCQCHGGSAKGYMEHFNKTDPTLHHRYDMFKQGYSKVHWMDEDVDLAEESCSPESMNLQSMAIMSKDVVYEDIADIGFHVMDQVFALQSLYFVLDGGNWKSKNKWLKDPNICNWHGVYCGFPMKATEIVLPRNNMRGTIPSYISLGASLRRLDLSMNDIHGTIPSELARLPHLLELAIASTNLTGTIPTEIGLMSRLHTLNLANNSLSSTIPPPTDLRLFTLRLDFNQLSGMLPEFIGKDSNRRMRILSVRHNMMNGTIPESLSNLTGLEYIDFSYNQFTGKPPDFISNSPNFEIVNFIESGLKGDLPDAYCTTERAFPVAILATCQEPNRIRNCRCCLENSTTLLQCQHELPPPVQQYVTGDTLK